MDRTLDQYRRAAGMSIASSRARSRHGGVQAPTKYELVINLAAKALGLDVPTRLPPAPTR
jgi:hypothetical protein